MRGFSARGAYHGCGSAGMRRWLTEKPHSPALGRPPRPVAPSSRISPPEPVDAPGNGAIAVGWLWVSTLMQNALSATGDQFGQLLDRLQVLTPKAAASFRGNSFAVYATATNLDISALTDPEHGGLQDLNDLQDFAGSIIQVLQLVQGRVTGAGR